MLIFSIHLLPTHAIHNIDSALEKEQQEVQRTGEYRWSHMDSVGTKTREMFGI
jgi:hypothetical protein